MKIFVSLFLAAGLLVCGILNPADIMADNTGGAPPPATVTGPPPSADETVLSATALVAMRHIVQARADIHAKNPARARNELNQALSLLDIIEAMDPAYRIRLRIWAAGKRLPFEETPSVTRDLAELYNFVDAMEDQVRRESARQHISRAQEYVQSGNRKGAGTELALADEALLGTEIDLPVRYTRARVEEAKELLAGKKLQAADAALKSAEDGIRFLSIVDYTNVTRAGKSLSRARTNYLARKFEAAEADLREAKAYLENEARSAQSAVREDAAKLAKEAESMEGKVRNWDEGTSRELKALYLKVKTLAVKAAAAFKSGKNRSG